jgi:hypothetical protein
VGSIRSLRSSQFTLACKCTAARQPRNTGHGQLADPCAKPVCYGQGVTSRVHGPRLVNCVGFECNRPLTGRYNIVSGAATRAAMEPWRRPATSDALRRILRREDDGRGVRARPWYLHGDGVEAARRKRGHEAQRRAPWLGVPADADWRRGSTGDGGCDGGDGSGGGDGMDVLRAPHARG